MFLIRLVVKNAFRHTLRSFLTILGITVALLAFGLLRTVMDAWYIGVNASSATRLVTRNAISMVVPLPLAYRERIRAVQGVTRVSYGNWFGGVYIDEKNFFANFVVDPESYLALYPEILIDPAQKTAFLRDRKSAAVGRKLAERFNWKLGDTVTLKGTIYPGEWEMVIRAVYDGGRPDTDVTTLFFHFDYLDETMKKTTPSRAGHVGFFMIGIDDPDRAGEISRAIDETFKNSQAETLTETEKAFQLGFVSMSEAILLAINLVSYVVILIILAVAANTMAMSVRERTAEFAVFKTLGFKGPTIAAMVVGESMILSLAGTGIGLALTAPLATAFGNTLSQYFPVFAVSRQTIWLGLAAGTFVGLAAAALPAWRVWESPIAESFRRIG